MTTPTSPAGLRVLLAEATKGPWELQDGSSWRRIGTLGNNGNVLCPYNARSDNHPDLTAGRGEDLYANLRLICALVNNAEQLIGAAERVEGLEAVLEEIARIGVNISSDFSRSADQSRIAREALSNDRT